MPIKLLSTCLSMLLVSMAHQKPLSLIETPNSLVMFGSILWHSKLFIQIIQVAVTHKVMVRLRGQTEL